MPRLIFVEVRFFLLNSYYFSMTHTSSCDISLEENCECAEWVGEPPTSVLRLSFSFQGIDAAALDAGFEKWGSENGQHWRESGVIFKIYRTAKSGFRGAVDWFKRTTSCLVNAQDVDREEIMVFLAIGLCVTSCDF